MEYDYETEKYICDKCNSQNVTESVEKHFADVEQDIYEDGEYIRTKMFAVDGILLTCNDCNSTFRS